MFTSYTWDERDRIFKRLNKLLPKRIVVSMHAEFHSSNLHESPVRVVQSTLSKDACFGSISTLFWPLDGEQGEIRKNEKIIPSPVYNQQTKNI